MTYTLFFTSDYQFQKVFLRYAVVHGASGAPDVRLPVRRHLRLHSALPPALDDALRRAVPDLRRPTRPPVRFHRLVPRRVVPLPRRAGLHHQRAEPVHHRAPVEDHTRPQAPAGRLESLDRRHRTDAHLGRQEQQLQVAVRRRDEGNEKRQR